MTSGRLRVPSKLTTLGLAAVLATLVGLSAARAYPANVDRYCSDDYFRHCSVYQLGSTELRRCMEAKGSSLSPNCQKALRDAGLVRSGRNRR